MCSITCAWASTTMFPRRPQLDLVDHAGDLLGGGDVLPHRLLRPLSIASSMRSMIAACSVLLALNRSWIRAPRTTMRMFCERTLCIIRIRYLFSVRSARYECIWKSLRMIEPGSDSSFVKIWRNLRSRSFSTAGGRQARDERLDRFPDRIDLGDVPEGDRGHDDPAPRHDNQEAFDFQGADRLSDGRLADADLVHEGVLIDNGPGHELAGDDLVPGSSRTPCLSASGDQRCSWGLPSGRAHLPRGAWADPAIRPQISVPSEPRAMRM